MDLTTLQPLTYGAIRKNQSTVEGLTVDVPTAAQRTENAVAFIRLAIPDATDEDFDAFTPGAIQMAAANLYRATFSRPEEIAPVPQNP